MVGQVRALGEDLQAAQQETAAAIQERDSWKREHDIKHRAYQDEIRRHRETHRRLAKLKKTAFPLGFLLGAVLTFILCVLLSYLNSK